MTERERERERERVVQILTKISRETGWYNY